MGGNLLKGGEIMYSQINLRRLGRYCQYARKLAGWTQAQIALEIGCDVRNVSQFENGYTTSWRILSWYIQNDLINNEIIKGCAKYA